MEEEVGVVDGRARLVVEARQADVEDRRGRDDARRRALHHRDRVPVLVKVLRDVVARVAAPHHERRLALAVRLRALELGRVAQHVAGEGREARDVRREVLLARVARRLDDVARVQGAGLGLAVGMGAFDRDGPATRRLIPGRLGDGTRGPDVEFEQFGVRLEELGQLVLGGEDGPVWREVDVGQVVVPDRVMKHQLVVAQSPVVAYSLFAVDDESVDAEHLESGR